MKFGIYLDVSVRAPFGAETERQAFEQALDLASLADESGFDYCWAAEHHFSPEYARTSAAEVFLAAVAARTKSIRVGVEALALKANHPVQIAERAAALDLVSNGRADLALSRPQLWAELSGFAEEGVVPADVWQETVRAVPQLWSREAASFTGVHFSMPERAVLPKPCQKPHPPLWASVQSEEGEREAALLGLGLLCPVLADQQDQTRRIAGYRELLENCEGAGAFVNGEVMLTDFMFCHNGNAKGVEAGARLLRTARDVTAAQVSLSDFGLGDAPTLAQGLAIGEPDTLIAALRGFEASGANGVLFRLNIADAMLQTEVRDSLRLFADEVLPVFKRRRARAAAE